MTKQTSNKKRLAKNTLLLYVRTMLVLFIGLFTSRVILNTLGVENYGIYNVVGGFVSMFSIISHTLTSTTQRFLNFELGKKENSRSQYVFGASMTIHILISLVLVLLLETVGLWFLNFKMNIDPDRMFAANCVFQFSIFTFILNIISQPYNAAIIAHERMGAFAYISLLDVLLKLLVVYALCVSPVDKLIFYSFLLLLEAFFIRAIYSVYSHRNFKETKYVFVKDKEVYKEITGFAGLNFIGVLASVLSGQGVNVLLNLFFGVVVNAAKGIASQVNHAVLKFVDDFMTALRPQITKACAAGQINEMRDLCYKGTRFSYYLILLFSIPLIFKTQYILSLWLKTYPDNAVIFVRLTLILSLCSVLSKTTINAILAQGKIQKMTFLIGSVNLVTLPICYVALKMGAPAYSAYIVNILIEFVLLFIRLWVLSGLLNFPIFGYVKHVLTYIFIVTVICVASSYGYSHIFADTIASLIAFLFFSMLTTCIVSFLFGTTKVEKSNIIEFGLKKIRR